MPIVDTQLLSYMYRLNTEAARRFTRFIDPFNSSTAVLSCWQRAAKTLKRKEDRMSLWNDFFKTALQEGLWDDVRMVSRSLPK